MISVIGLRGDEFRYQEETYNYDLNRWVESDGADWNIDLTKISQYPNALVEKGARWTFKGTGQALSELLTTMSK